MFSLGGKGEKVSLCMCWEEGFGFFLFGVVFRGFGG